MPVDLVAAQGFSERTIADLIAAGYRSAAD